ncbi:hypothetical protein [Sphingomonas sp. C3-2]|nr:hypothetical protein [Sphingomonas sp. C3-2]WOK35149.1 hypothetical protein QYC26_08860 [Sphingomonas sp. C3-2]
MRRVRLNQALAIHYLEGGNPKGALRDAATIRAALAPIYIRPKS